MPKITRFIQKVLDVRMRWHIGSFVALVLIFGLLYTKLTPSGHGIGKSIGKNIEPLSDITFLKGIYFSIVTISSLGYGHMYPMGISKALVCIEVLGGLVLIGIMIAKVTSQSLAYRVSRLFSSDAQKRLEDIATRFDTFRVEVDRILSNYDTPYRRSSSQTSSLSENKSVLISCFQKIIIDLKSNCIELRDYLSYEIGQDNYFQIAPASAMMKMGNAVEEALFVLGRRIADLQKQSRDEILDQDNRHRISEAIDSQKKICDLVNQHATDQDTLNVFQRIEETCKGVIDRFLAVPEVPEELHLTQPDQVLQDTDEPQ